MSGYVFISYASEDKVIADAVSHHVEAGGIRCWIAPRDVPPGAEWPAAIAAAIDACRVFVLVLSTSCNDSKQTLREVTIAVDAGKPIIPFRIQDVAPSPSLRYLLSVPHWLDAMSPPLDAHLERLLVSIRSVLDAGTAPRPDPAEHVAPPTRAGSRKMLLAIAGIIAVAAAVAFVILRRPPDGSEVVADPRTRSQQASGEPPPSREVPRTEPSAPPKAADSASVNSPPATEQPVAGHARPGEEPTPKTGSSVAPTPDLNPVSPSGPTEKPNTESVGAASSGPTETTKRDPVETAPNVPGPDPVPVTPTPDPDAAAWSAIVGRPVTGAAFHKREDGRLGVTSLWRTLLPSGPGRLRFQMDDLGQEAESFVIQGRTLRQPYSKMTDNVFDGESLDLIEITEGEDSDLPIVWDGLPRDGVRVLGARFERWTWVWCIPGPGVSMVSAMPTKGGRDNPRGRYWLDDEWPTIDGKQYPIDPIFDSEVVIDLAGVESSRGCELRGGVHLRDEDLPVDGEEYEVAVFDAAHPKPALWSCRLSRKSKRAGIDVKVPPGVSRIVLEGPAVWNALRLVAPVLPSASELLGRGGKQVALRDVVLGSARVLRLTIQHGLPHLLAYTGSVDHQTDRDLDLLAHELSRHPLRFSVFPDRVIAPFSMKLDDNSVGGEEMALFPIEGTERFTPGLCWDGVQSDGYRTFVGASTDATWVVIFAPKSVESVGVVIGAPAFQEFDSSTVEGGFIPIDPITNGGFDIPVGASTRRAGAQLRGAIHLPGTEEYWKHSSEEFEVTIRCEDGESAQPWSGRLSAAHTRLAIDYAIPRGVTTVRCEVSGPAVWNALRIVRSPGGR